MKVSRKRGRAPCGPENLRWSSKIRIPQRFKETDYRKLEHDSQKNRRHNKYKEQRLGHGIGGREGGTDLRR